MKRISLFLGFSALVFVISVLVLQFPFFKPAIETITFFPLDETVQYRSAGTTLTLQKEKEHQAHKVNWEVSSTLDREAYLRQDMGLLYMNGILKSKVAKWRQQTAQLNQRDVLSAEESAKYEAITFHYSELHDKDARIASAQRMTEDLLYVIDSPFSPLSSFRIAKSKLEKEWKQVLDNSTQNRLNKSLKKAGQIHGINAANYMVIPLYELRKYEDQPISGFTQWETANILGRLWEGIYKNYYLGIKKSDGTVVDPIDSTMPLILISRDKKHLLLVTQTKAGESIILKQLLQGSD